MEPSERLKTLVSSKMSAMKEKQQKHGATMNGCVL